MLDYETLYQLAFCEDKIDTRVKNIANEIKYAEKDKNYTLINKIGIGGGGEVYSAIDPDNTYCVVKHLIGSSSFKDESFAELQNQLLAQHENVVRIKEVFKDKDDDYCFSMCIAWEGDLSRKIFMNDVNFSVVGEDELKKILW